MTAAPKQESPVITTKSDNHNKFTKIALIALVVTFLIILSEVAYLIFAKPDNSIFKISKITKQEENERPTVDFPLQPTPSPVPKNQEQAPIVNSIEGNALINSLDLLAEANRLEASDLATIHTEISGIVVYASTIYEEKDGIKYLFRLKIKRDSGQIGHSLNEEEAIGAQVKIFEDGVEKQGSLTDIREGDVITMISVLNLLDENPYQSVILRVTR